MKKALIIFFGLILSLAQILKTSNFLKSSEGYSLLACHITTGAVSSRGVLVSDINISLSQKILE